MKCSYAVCENECNGDVCLDCLRMLDRADTVRASDFRETKKRNDEDPCAVVAFRVKARKDRPLRPINGGNDKW